MMPCLMLETLIFNTCVNINGSILLFFCYNSPVIRFYFGVHKIRANPNKISFNWIMEHFSRRRWTTIPAPLVSNSVHEGKHFFVSVMSGLFPKLIYLGTCTVVHLLLLKISMTEFVHSICSFWALKVCL